MTRRARDDRGVAANVAITPAVLMLFFLVIQMSLLYYGQSVATTAAQHGIDAARVYNAPPGAGEDAVNEFVTQAGGIEVTSVDVRPTPTDVSVRVQADPLEVIPGFPFTIDVELEAPVERLVE